MIFVFVSVSFVYVIIIMIGVENSLTFLLELSTFGLYLLDVGLDFLSLLFQIQYYPYQGMGGVLSRMSNEGYFSIFILLVLFCLLPPL